MPVNYYKTAFRALVKHKGFSFINIAGLTLGLAATLLIALFVWDEYQYDKFVPEGDRIYRLCNQVTHNEGTEALAVTPPTYSSVLQREFPGVEAATREKLQTLVWIFTGIAIFVGCLGLFGLAAYTAETRRKEVGIRKILGASAQSVVLLLSKGFVGPVILALLIAAPIRWYCMQQWLQGFAYRTTMTWWAFAAAGLGAILIASLTVCYQAIRAALANPVNSLRAE